MRGMPAFWRCLLLVSAVLFPVGLLPAQAVDGGAGEAALRQRIAGLEEALRKLQEENAALKHQLEVSGRKVQLGKEPAITEPAKPAKLLPEGAKWISSTGKRHNPGCRYYGKGEGHAGKPGEGVACKVCGG